MWRAIGMFQTRFTIVRGPAQFWDQTALWEIKAACVIVRNMPVENEQGQEEDYENVGTIPEARKKS